MNRAKQTVMAIVVLLGGLGLGLVDGAKAAGVALPYGDSFQGYSVGPLPVTGSWSTNGGSGSAIVTNSTTPAMIDGGTRALKVTDCNVTLDVDGTYTNAYWRFYTVPTRYEDEEETDPPTNFSGVAAAFYVNTAGVVRAYYKDGATNAWMNLTSAPSVDSNQWVGFLVQVDYGAQKWHLSMTTAGYGSTLDPVTGAGLDMPVGAGSSIDNVAVYNNAILDALYLYLPPSPGGGVGLPFFDGFEEYTSPVRSSLTNYPLAMTRWSLSGDEAYAVVTNSPVIQAAQALKATNATLTLKIDETLGHYTNIWCQMYIIPVGYEDDGGASAPSVAAGAATALYVSTNGNLRAYTYDGAANVWTTLVQNVSTSSWLGLSMHVDYSSRLWDVYVASGGYGVSMAKTNAAPLRIQSAASAVTEIGEVVIQNNTFLDAVAVSIGAVAVTTTGTASAGNLIASPFTGGVTNPTAILAHHYGTGDDTLAGMLGQDLMSGLTPGDRLRIFTTNGWNDYILTNTVEGAGGSYWAIANVDAIAPANVHVTPGMGVWLMRANPSNAVAFYPYTDIPVVTNAVYGTSWTNSAGWNLLGWPYLTDRAQGATTPGSWGFSGGTAAYGDLLYIYNNGYYTRLWWNTLAGANQYKWMQGGNASAYVMRKGNTFWYYRAAASDANWQVGQ